MYKVFWGEKCILISDKEVRSSEKGAKLITFISAEMLHREYYKFLRSKKHNTLIIIGDLTRTWTVFRSLFLFIKAAGGVVLNHESELLMIYRNGHWDLPKGKIEPGESSDHAAVREVAEECGVKKLKIVRPLPSTYHVFYQDKKNCMKQTDWFKMLCSDSAKLIPQKEEGIQDAKWMSRDEVKRVLNRVYPSLRGLINSTFSF